MSATLFGALMGVWSLGRSYFSLYGVSMRRCFFITVLQIKNGSTSKYDKLIVAAR